MKELTPIKMVERIKALIRESEPEINLVDYNIELTNGESCGTLKDVLEDSVDEKFYLDPKKYEHLDLGELDENS